MPPSVSLSIAVVRFQSGRLWTCPLVAIPRMIRDSELVLVHWHSSVEHTQFAAGAPERGGQETAGEKKAGESYEIGTIHVCECESVCACV